MAPPKAAMVKMPSNEMTPPKSLLVGKSSVVARPKLDAGVLMLAVPEQTAQEQWTPMQWQSHSAKFATLPQPSHGYVLGGEQDVQGTYAGR